MKNLIQTTLDTALYTSKGILSHDQQKTGPDADQYIVYSQSGDSEEFHADDAVMLKAGSFTVRHYYRKEKLNTYQGRQSIKEVENLIESSMKTAGFRLPFGRFDGGDIDDIGYMVTIFEFDYWRAV